MGHVSGCVDLVKTVRRKRNVARPARMGKRFGLEEASILTRYRQRKETGKGQRRSLVEQDLAIGDNSPFERIGGSLTSSCS